MNNELLISIIVPIYNSERFLKECIDSVISQSYKNWELLLVDDGSKDSSPSICDEYALQDIRIKVFHKQNSGVSNSRNLALQMANGDFVMFVDADDFWCDNNVLEKLVKIASEYDLDILRGEYKTVDIHGNVITSPILNYIDKTYSNKPISSFEFIKYGVKNDFFVFLSLFKRERINELRFNEEQIFLEDMRFYSQLLLQDLKCMYVPSVCFYSYRKHNESVSFTFNPRKLKDSFNMCYFFYEASLKTDNKSLSLYFQQKSLSIYKSTLSTLADDEYFNDCKRYIDVMDLNRLRKLLNDLINNCNVSGNKFFYQIPPYWVVLYFRLRRYMSIMKNRLMRI